MDITSISNPDPSALIKEEDKMEIKMKMKKKKSVGSAVKLSTDPQSVAARQRRHRISDRFKILKSLVPGGSKLDTVSMLEEAIEYVKFLQAQISIHQTMIRLAGAKGGHDPPVVENYNNNNNNIESDETELGWPLS